MLSGRHAFSYILFFEESESTIQSCNQILLIDPGKIVERRIHPEHMELGGASADLVKTQLTPGKGPAE